MDLITIIAPVEWDQIEPTQGHFDFTIVDGMIKQARQNHVRLVLLWFGTWKNSMSTYVPAYIKHDFKTYEKVKDDKGQPQDILSPFDPDTMAADANAFAKLMAHLRSVDTDHTVIMMQVENEIGMLPSVRDCSVLAETAFNEQVPHRLISYLKAHHTDLNPNVRDLWEAQGARENGTWQQLFGSSVGAQEIFQAWYFAAYANSVANAGKAEYPLPMYVNAALIRPGKLPGQYPSAGPLPHLFDVWKPAAPDIDILAIDTYFPNFMDWADKFKRPDNPLFIPEANQAGKVEAGANAFYAIGQLDAIGFSPFAIDKITKDSQKNLTDAYDILSQMSPEILSAQGEGRMHGFRPRVSFEGVVDDSPQSFVLGKYRFTVNFIDPFSPKEKQNTTANGGLIIQTSNDNFIVAGSGIVVTFDDATIDRLNVGIEQIIEGHYVKSTWKPGRWLNGDESHQGRHLRLNTDGFGIQKLKLYRFK